MNYFSATEPNI